MIVRDKIPYLCLLFDRSLNIAFVTALYMLVLFGTTAKEFIHGFTGHIDTIHQYHHSETGLVIENEHHHCDFLSYGIPVFDNDIAFAYIPVLKQTFTPQYLLRDVQFVQREIIRASLRGPPASV